MSLPILTEADFLAIEKELCERSLAEFAKRAWKILEPASTLKWGWALDAICMHLEAVTDGRIKRLLMNVPPGSMKSLLTGVIWPAWEWTQNPHLRYLGTAHKQDLAVRDNLKCRRLIQSDWYQKRWPTKLTSDQNAKTKFENDSTGFREAMAFASMTGSRGDRVLLDDPHSVDDANSLVKLESDITTFREALPSRVNNDESAIIIIMQRLNEGDVSSVALELGYVHLCIPMRFEKSRKCKTVIGWEDPRTEEGELMFPERFPEHQVKELEKTLGTYATAGQLQQRPSPRGGGMIRTAWFGEYAVLPKLKYSVVLGDTAQKIKERNDFSVFEHWGLGEDGYLYLIDLIRGKWEADELKKRAIAFWIKAKRLENGTCRYMGVEDKSSGTGLIQQIKKESKIRIPIKAIPRNTDKYTRFMDAQPYIESGYVKLPTQAPWLSDYLAECERLTPEFKGFDDQIDPTMDAIDLMLDKKRTSILDAL